MAAASQDAARRLAAVKTAKSARSISLVFGSRACSCGPKFLTHREEK